MSSTAPPQVVNAPAAAARPMAGLLGIYIAAMMVGLNHRVGALALPDVRGALGFGFDDASWITTAYAAGELIVMPFAAWFAITLSVRRFELWMLGACALLALILPFIRDLDVAIALRFLQGAAGGTMIPVLMMAALKFLPAHVRLHGLALYAMTATFAPNLSVWLTAQWTDGLSDWRWAYWQVIPLAIVAGWLMRVGLPREPVQSRRFREANWLGMACGVPALGLVAIALDQGVRLDWFNSPLITVSLLAGLVLLAVYLLSEWRHPSPFIQLRILGRRNLALGFTVFVLVLVVMMSGAMLPASYLAPLQGYRPLQLAPVGLIIALPQLVLGFLVALLLYRKRVDARIVFGTGLFLIALACLSGAQLTSAWNRDQFVVAQTLHAFGQPMAVISMLFLCTSVVQPHEGPYVSGAINTLRAFGLMLGAALVGELVTVRGRFHAEMLLDHAALASNALSHAPEPFELVRIISQQSQVLAIADAYRALGILALLLIPAVLCLVRIPAPSARSTSPGG